LQSRADLATAATVSVPAIAKLEKTGRASVETLAAVAGRLGLAVDDLI
jgi:transcriptional regulator with XRE-family HTH domain